MEARYTMRKHPLLADCQVAPEMFEQVIPRLDTFMTPLVQIFPGQVAEQHATTSVGGLWSNLARKNVAAMADRVGHSRLPWPAFLGGDAGDDEPLRAAWRSQVQRHWGHGDGGLVFEPAGCAQSGHESGGVARQWGGRLGQGDTCHVAMSLGYVSRQGHPRVAQRLFLPKAWTKATVRRDQAGVPTAYRASRTRHQVAWEWLSTNGGWLPPSWMAGDDERGRPSGLRRRLAAVGERSLWAVPANTALRALAREPPAESGRGRPGQRPWHRVETWRQSLRAASWPRSDVRDGRKGPVVVEAVQRRVVSRTHRRQQGEAETLGVRRSRDRDQQEVVQVDSDLSQAVPETPRWALARVAKAEHRVEECLQRSQSAAGLADYEVRHWRGWQQHQTLSLRATWCLVRETARGKKWTPAITVPQLRQGIAMILHEALQCGTKLHRLKECQKRLQRNELARFYHWQQRHRLPPLNLDKRQC